MGDAPELRRAALAGYRPNAVFAFAPEPTDAIPVLAGKGLVEGGAAAYVCERFACRRPVTTAAELRELLGAPG